MQEANADQFPGFAPRNHFRLIREPRPVHSPVCISSGTASGTAYAMVSGSVSGISSDGIVSVTPSCIALSGLFCGT